MTQQTMGFLAFASIGGPGIILMFAAIIIKLRAITKNKRCTAIISGTITEHRYRGEGRMFPVAEYEVDGSKYECMMKYSGIRSVRRVPSVEPSNAWVDEKGYLYIRQGMALSFERIMEELWPIGSAIDVHYDPADPKTSYIGVPTTNAFLVNMFLFAGLLLTILGLVMAYLANAGLL